MQISKSDVLKVLFLLACVIGIGVAVVNIFVQMPIENTSLGIDYIFDRMRGGDIRYEVVNGLRNPPWSAIFFMPLAELNMRVAWGIWAYITLLILGLAVPITKRKWLYVLSVVLMLTSFPTFRILADVQIDAQVIAGVLLIAYAMPRQNPYWLTLGALWGTAKPQAVFLFIPFVALEMLRSWKRRNLAIAIGLTLAVVVPLSIWKGREWLAALNGTYQAGSLIDMSITAALNRMEFVPSPLIFIIWAFILLSSVGLSLMTAQAITREKATFLISASLLLAPYSASNSVVIILAVGALVLLQKQFALGLGLFIIADVFTPFNRAEFVHIYSYYWTFFLLVSWVMFGAVLWHDRKANPAPEANLEPHPDGA